MTSARPASAASIGGKKKRRRMKQMEGLLLVSRPKLDDAALAAVAAAGASAGDEPLKPRPVKPKKAHVMLQPQQLQLAYSAQEDQEMATLLGRIDLAGAKLEQVPDGFLIHGAKPGKKLKLHDNDKATIDAWFFAVYTAITEFARAPIVASRSDMDGWMFSGVLSGSLRDEATEGAEYELSCQLVIPSRGLDEPSIRWKVWRTAHEIHAFDEELRRVPSVAALLRDVGFPRDRKRDSIFGGLRRKSMQELKEQQLSVYIGRVFSLRQLSADPAACALIRRFLRFNDYFELSFERVDEDNNVEEAELPIPPRVESTEHHTVSETHSDARDNNTFNSADLPNDEVADTFEEQPPPCSETQPRLSRAASVHFDDDFDELTDVTPESDPIASKKLHKQIIRTVRDIFAGDEDRVRDFQDQTKDFGRDKTDAKEYCAFLHGALGSKQSCIVIPMMARLMPDDDKRLALMEARTTIVRKAARRNRRRSKQFSESVVMHQQQQEQREANQSNEWLSAPSRTRPKSDSLSVLANQPMLNTSYYSQRSSMVEPRSFVNPNESTGFQRVSFDDNGRNSLPDARRKLDSRPSISLFGETIQNNTIDEESSGAGDSEDRGSERENHDERIDEKRPEAPSPEMKSLPPVFRRVNSNPWLQQPPRSTSNSQPAYGQRAGRSRGSSRSIESIGFVADATEEEERHEQSPAEDVEENPVLARLKKQGAAQLTQQAVESEVLITSCGGGPALPRHVYVVAMAAVSSEELQEAWQKVKKMGMLPEAPSPKVPTFTARTPIKQRLLGIQHYLNALEYNYTGTLYFDVNKNRSFKSIVNTAKDIAADMLPIQCLEAVFVAGYLTANILDLERFPISFKSECGSAVHRHIILAVRHQLNKWGALGLSRSDKLMYKDVRFNSLSELIQDFRLGFESVYHTVVKVYIGFPFPHDIHSSEKVEWRVLNVVVNEANGPEMASHVDGFAKEALDVLAFKRAKGALPDNFQNKYPLHTPEKEPSTKSPEKRVLLSGARFDFPTMPGDGDATTPPSAAVNSGESPEICDQTEKNPILVAPDKLVFKRALVNQTQVPPSNVFLQNTTSSPFTIKVEEPTGQLEIVTKSTHSFSTPEEQAANVAKAVSIFRVSAKGMIVIAIRCKARAVAQPDPTPQLPTTAAAAEPVRKRSVELKRNKTPRGIATSPQKTAPPKASAPTDPPKLVVYFRCTRMTVESECQENDTERVETYVSELPFTIAS